MTNVCFDEFTDLEDCGLALACLGTLLNLPIGLIALIYATQALAFVRAKDHNRASYFYYISKRISIVAIILGLLTIVATSAFFILF